MKYDSEQIDKLLSNAIKQLKELNEIIASLKLTQIEQPEPEPKAPTTIDAVYEQVNPKYSTIPTEVPYLINVNQVDAFAQLLTLVDCLDSHFGEGNGKHVWYIEVDGNYEYCRADWEGNLPVIRFKTEKAVQHARDYFMPLFKRFYGVTE